MINLLPFNNSGINSKNHMNPIGYYLQTNPELQSFIDEKLSEVDGIKNETIKNILLDIITQGTFMEKIQAVTLIRAANLFGLQ